MANNMFLRTVRMGGFDKGDVLAYIDELNSKIYNLEQKVKDQAETIEKLQKAGASAPAAPVAAENNGDFEGKAELENKVTDLEKKVEEAKNKVAELMASTDTMKVQIADYEQQLVEKNVEVETKVNEIDELKDKLEQAEKNAGAAAASSPAFDLGNVFIEAQNTANRVVTEAKKAAQQMTDEAEAQANQIIDDANNQAETTVTTAQAEATRTLETAQQEADRVRGQAYAEADRVTSTAQAEADETTANAEAEAKRMIDEANAQVGLIKAKSADLREGVKNEYTNLSENITQIISSLNDLFGASIGSADKARDLIDEGLGLVEE